MPRWGFAMMTLVATAVLVGGVSAASGNEPPLAEAGLDQTVDNGTTVYLDAGGSVDPDGSIATVQWSVTDPDGAPVATTDDTVVRSSFTPTRTGVYTANLSVTDDSGATVDDSLYVTVEERDGPEVTLSGPGQAIEGEETEFSVAATAGDADLRQLYWIETGSVERTVDLSGDESTVTINRSFDETGPLELDATVIDAKGYSETSSLQIQVLSPSGAGTYEHCPDGGSPYFVEDELVGCNDGGADMIFEDRVLEANGEDGLSLPNADGVLVEMIGQEQVEEMMGDSNGAPTRSEVSQNYEERLEEEEESFLNTRPGQSRRLGDPGGRSSSGGSSGASANTGTSTSPSPPIDSVAPSPSSGASLST